MKNIVRYILTGFFGLVLTACIVMAFTAGTKARKTLTCTGLEVVILDSMQNSFVTKADVRGYLDKEYGTYIGEVIDSIDLAKVEEIIDGRSAVLKSQAYVTRNGVLHIEVTQRRPVVRFQKKDGGFYADASGYIFPLQRSYASHVHVIDGNIPLAANSGYKGAIEDPKEKEWFEKMMNVVNYIENSRTWRDKIVQISVDKGTDLILIPREGNERFLFGQPTDIEDKFRKMEKYYTNIVPAKGKDYYRFVDLKYEGQIVCKVK